MALELTPRAPSPFQSTTPLRDLGPGIRRDERAKRGYTPANRSKASPVIRRTVHSSIAAAPRLS